MSPEPVPHQVVMLSERSWNQQDEYSQQALRDNLWRPKNRDDKGWECLALYEEYGQILPGDFVGAVWLQHPQMPRDTDAESRSREPGEQDEPVSPIALQVLPKFPDMDYLAMYLASANHPVVSGRMDEVFRFWPDQPPISASFDRELSILLVAAYLKELRDLCMRHMRRNFIRTQQNLVGKVKGRPLLSANIRENWAHGRYDRCVCQYSIISDDCRENQILLAALERCAKFLGRENRTTAEKAGGGALLTWVRIARSALCNVSLRAITPQDFQGISYRGTFVHYRKPHQLARFIIRWLGPDPDGTEGISEKPFPPFAIYTPELFERYTEVLLRETLPGDGRELIPGYQKDNVQPAKGNGQAGYTVRPDFRVQHDGHGSTHCPVIMDCKYKPMPTTGEKEAHGDVYQMMGYALHTGITKKHLDTELYLLYPDTEADHPNDDPGTDLQDKGFPKGLRLCHIDRSFHSPLHFVCVPCPRRE